MAITKKLIHFNQLSNFNTQKLSANRENTAYTIGVGGAVTTGEPYILFHSIVFIKDVLKIWTHGSLYDCGETDLSDYLTADEIAEVYATIEALNDKQDTISDLEAIRNGASKGATALQAVPDEYVTETELTGKGYVTTSSMNTELAKKVDKVSGKGLSTNDFTTVLKTKLEGLSNYDDTELSDAIESLRGDFDALVSGDTTTAIKTFNEVIAFLDGISDSEDLDSIIAGIERQIATKQDIITDLETIRSGAALGATALQSYTEKYTGTYSKPSGGIPKSDLASAVQTSLGKADTALQSHQDISGKLDVTTAASTYLTKTDAASTYLGKTAKAASAASADSATKATQDASGNVITATYATKTELNAKGTYSKPSGGIPKTDLASAVQTSLGKADTALQSYTETDPVFKASAAAGITSENITSWNGKQDKLVSGTNIKTVNGMSLLGSGNIAISAAYPVVEHASFDNALTIAPNTFYIIKDTIALDISFQAEVSGVANEYVFQFTPTYAGFTLSVPDSVVWVNGEVPIMGPAHTYVVSIVNNLAVWAEF